MNSERPCENCGGVMTTFSIRCGGDPGREDMCHDCGRREESGWGGRRVTFPGFKREPSK